MCFPYLQFYWKTPKLKYSNVPQLFLYGKVKRTMFHSAYYIQKLKNDANCNSKGYENAGHWFHWDHADEVAADMKKFMEAKVIKTMKES